MSFFTGRVLPWPHLHVVALFPWVLLLSLALIPAAPAAAPAVTYTRFCASCGIWGIDSFSSQSGQFIVHGSSVPLRLPLGTNAASFIEIEPQLVAVTADRTKRVFCEGLGIPENFRDRIHVSVLDRAPAGQPIALISQLHTDGFVYKMGLPSRIENIQFAKGLVQALLLEWANRGARRCAELPHWLVEGMTRQVFTAVVPAYVVNKKPITIELAGYDRLGQSKLYLQTNTPLTIQELSFANLSQATSEQRARFEASAHLLVHQLLRLPHGPALLARFIQTLPHTLNWQTALFAVYGEHFQTPLQFEKWWMLNWVEFKSRGEGEVWPLALTLDRLDSLLRTPMEVRLATNTIPTHREAPLQELIQIADFSVQKEILSQKVQHMFFMSLSVPSEAQALWSAYQREIDSYLQKRTLNEYRPGLKSDPEQRLQALIQSTLDALDELDADRAELRAGRTPRLKELAAQASR